MSDQSGFRHLGSMSSWNQYMGLISKIEAAIHLGIGMELLENCCGKCPKPNQNRVLAVVATEQGDMIDEKELEDFHAYLHAPWPLSPKGKRPHLPDVIKEDVRQECHYSCAICGHMDNGEVAHIDPVADRLNNGPDNLIYLCPNHHTKYDLGHKPTANITEEEVKAAKVMKRKSRQRMMRLEGNVTKACKSLLTAIARIQREIEGLPTGTMINIYETEAKALMGLLSEATQEAQEYAAKGVDINVSEKLLLEKAPAIAKAALGSQADKSGHEIRSRMTQVADLANEILIDLDELECPHCSGRGLTGLVGDYCAYCKGSCFVTKKVAEDYAPEDIDEAECPHCHGVGTIGHDQHWCPVCRGSCIVTRDEADEYDEDDVDEVDCPRCQGNGVVGHDQHYCPFCKGACRMTREEAGQYDEKELDEVDCPHCDGSGILGYDQHFCPYCKGACWITQDEADEYDENKIDEVDCPHCDGDGVLGYDQHYCPYCRGACKITQSKAERYDRNDIDEVECPHCQGQGTRGLARDCCKFCHGACVVSSSKAEAYREKFTDRD
jgi:RecJ-like exonuclease